MPILEYYGGKGYLGLPENGTYCIKIASSETTFYMLSEARKMYDSLFEEKAIWDKTGSKLELIECHFIKEENPPKLRMAETRGEAGFDKSKIQIKSKYN